MCQYTGVYLGIFVLAADLPNVLLSILLSLIVRYLYANSIFNLLYLLVYHTPSVAPTDINYTGAIISKKSVLCIPLCFQIINATAQNKCTNLRLIGPFCRML